MTDLDLLVADLRQYTAWEVPTGIANKALAHAVTELPEGAGTGSLVKRAAYLIRQRGDGHREWTA